MKFLAYIIDCMIMFIIPPPPPSLPACYSSTVRDVRAARHGGAVLARRVLLLKQDGCARRSSSGADLKQCRGGRKGGRGIHSCVSCPARRATSPQRKRRALLTWWRLVSGTFYGNGLAVWVFVTKRQPDLTKQITELSAEDSRGRSRRYQRCPCYVWEVREDI